MLAIVLVKLVFSHNGLNRSSFEYGESGGFFEIKDAELRRKGRDEE